MSGDLQLLKTGEVAAMLGVGRTTLWRLRKSGFPAPIRLGHSQNRYRLCDVQAWLEAQGNGPSATPNGQPAT